MRYPPGMSLLKGLLDLIFPEVCRVCGADPARWSPYLCPDCEAEIWRPGMRFGECADIPFVTWIGWLGPYQGAVRTAVHAMKFGRQRAFARHLGWMLARRMPHQAPRPDLIVPIPLSRQAFSKRGFNQAEELALGMADALGVAARPGLLRRRVTGRPQRSLPLAERVANVRDCFELGAATLLRNRRVALVDDVATTGATMAAAARLLRCAGAAEVSAYVVARTEKRC
ncbi:MAG: ComF family protein [Candidatus Wallbacteria bacterium]|nr:ComF family protein [Candidatus Wallbacteria bacterium]